MGTLPQMATGAGLVIKINSVTIAYAQSMSFADRMATAPVGGIGSYSYDAIEPLQYSASGSMVITQYSQAALDAISQITKPSRVDNPGRVNATQGNTVLRSKWFSPLMLMISSTFDIDVYNRAQSSTDAAISIGDLVYTLQDCRLNAYALTFTPGSLVQENIGYLCLAVIDRKYEQPYE